MLSNVPIQAYGQVIEATGHLLEPTGFRRQKTVLRIVDRDNCGIVEFQRSTKNSREKLLFTVNLGVICGQLLDSGPDELKKARIEDAHLRQRIGMLLPNRPDKWWEITEATDSKSLAHEVSELILEKAVPYIRYHLSTESLISLWESGQSPGLTDGQRVDLLAQLKRGAA